MRVTHGLTASTEPWLEGVVSGRALQVEIDAGKQWPGGDSDDGNGVYRSGTFLHHAAGSSHSPRSENGCVLFVYYPEG